jgi:hypothetical protein
LLQFPRLPQVIIVQGRQLQIVDGTSCSAPIFGAILGLANAQLLRSGLPVSGAPWKKPLLGAARASTASARHGRSSTDRSTGAGF